MVLVEVTRKAYLASIVPVIVNAVLNEHQVVVDIIAFVSKGDFPRSRLGEKQRGKILASWVTRKMRTIAQFGIRDPDAADSQITEVAEPRSHLGTLDGKLGAGAAGPPPVIHEPPGGYAPLPTGISEMPGNEEMPMMLSPEMMHASSQDDREPRENHFELADNEMQDDQAPPPVDRSSKPAEIGVDEHGQDQYLPYHPFRGGEAEYDDLKPLPLTPSATSSTPHNSALTSPATAPPPHISLPSVTGRESLFVEGDLRLLPSQQGGGFRVMNSSGADGSRGDLHGDEDDSEGEGDEDEEEEEEGETEWPEEATMHMNLTSGRDVSSTREGKRMSTVARPAQERDSGGGSLGLGPGMMMRPRGG